MMKSHKILIALCLIFVSAFFTQTGYCADIYETVYKKADLPTGGQYVPNSKVKSEIYYFTNRDMMWRDRSNVQKFSGLYHSVNDGQTWHLLCNYFEFQGLFIHPVTGKLFAIITDTWLADNDGYLVPEFSHKAITSFDGKHWKDIMGKRKHSWLINIFQDPDHPDRVCLKAWALRGYILQSKDADYSDWNLIPDSKWTTDHPNSPKQ